MSFDKSNKSSSNEDYLGFTDNKSNSENEEDSVSTSSQFCPLSELPLGHRISFLENGASEGCQWLLLYSVNSYGQYLVPKNLIPKPALKVLLENNSTKMVPEELNFVCECIDHEKYHRKWAPYILLCFTYFIGEALRVHFIHDAFYAFGSNSVSVIAFDEKLSYRRCCEGKGPYGTYDQEGCKEHPRIR